MTRVKMCGLSRPEDIEWANELGPDYIGYVFWEKSRRNIDEDRARQLTGLLDERIMPVGVFVDEDPVRIAGLLERGIIRAAQLHGSEDEDYIRRLKGLWDAPVIKAFRIKEEADLDQVRICSADMVLLDGGMGDGKTFNWKLLSGVDREYILAGGLNPGNVIQAVRTLSPMGVDVSSGIEREGFKDRELMEAFMRAVRT